MRNLRRLLFILFFFSGFSALVYEVVWARQLSLIFGTTTYAISSILTIFFAGLALGSYVFGRVVDSVSRIQANQKRILANERMGNLLLLYGLLEVGTGLYAAATPWIFKLIEQLQISLWQFPSLRESAFAHSRSVSGFSIFTFLLCFAGLIIPTSLMGGDLPILAKAISRIEANVKRIKANERIFRRTQDEVGGMVGLLYAVNTTGAAAGAFLTGFFLIMTLGVNETIFTAAMVNVFIGVTVLYLSRMDPAQSYHSPSGTIPQYHSVRGRRTRLVERFGGAGERMKRPMVKWSNGYMAKVVLVAFGMAGFAALALEVLWTRVLILFFGGSVYAFTVVLVTFLLGIAFGSAVISRMMKWGVIKNYLLWFGCLGLILGVSVIATLPLFGKMPFWLLKIIREARGSFEKVILWELLLSFGIMFIPTFLMGSLFPLGIRIYTRGLRHLGQSVGRLYAVNTLGGIGGSLAAGFLLIPLMGVQKGIWLAGVIYLVIGVAILYLSRIQANQKRMGANERIRTLVHIGVSVLVLVAILMGFRLAPWNKHFLISGPYANWRYYVNDTWQQAAERMQASELLYYKEGLEGTVAVKKSGEQIFLRINGKTDAATGLDMDTQILSGQLPMLLHPNPEDVLVVGLGSGITLGSVQTHPLKTVEAVEIEPAVIEAAGYFSEANYNALGDKRLKMIVGDGRNYLLVNQKKHDVITSEPSNVWLSGNSKLFTKEYFELAKKRLKESGIFAHWIQLYSLSTDDLKTEIKTFQSVFPHTTVWDNLSSYDLLLVGSQEPINLGPAFLEKKFATKSVRTDLARIFIETTEQFLSYLALDAQGVEQFTQGARENTDNRPLLEFSAPKTLYQATISTNLEALKDLRPDLGGQHADFRKKVVLGKMFFTGGENEKAALEYEEALRFDPDNGWLKITLGELYLDLGQVEAQKGNGEAAERNFSRAVQLIPDNPQAHFYLAVIYKIQGKKEEAKKELQISLNLNPHQPEAEKLLKELKK